MLGSDRIRRCGWNQIASKNGDYIDLFGRRVRIEDRVHFGTLIPLSVAHRIEVGASMSSICIGVKLQGTSSMGTSGNVPKITVLIAVVLEDDSSKTRGQCICGSTPIWGKSMLEGPLTLIRGFA